MAGTGHSYEIANVHAVKEAAAALADRLPEGPGRSWFLSRKFLRHLTSDVFTVRIYHSHVEATADGFDPAERDMLVAKIAHGREVRLFSPEIFSAIGGELEHIADWIAWLKGNDPKLHSKLSRVTVEQARLMAGSWSAKVASLKPASRGTETRTLDTRAGRRWVELLDAAALAAEGYAMSHCVATYSPQLEGKSSRIYSLRDVSDHSLLTAEFTASGDRAFLRQVKAFGNGPVPPHGQSCLVELMTFLVADGGGAAEAAGLCRNADGSWSRAIDVWERIEWMGYSGVASNREMIVMSPRNPVLPLLKIVFSYPHWRTSLPAGELAGVAVALEVRHFHASEQRAFAKIRNLIGHVAEERYAMTSGPEMEVADGTVIPVLDLMPRREIGGVTCLVAARTEGELLHVPHSGDEARTLLIVAEERHMVGAGVYPARDSYSKNSRTVTGVVFDPSRWNAAESARCLAVMNAAGVQHLRTDNEAGRALRSKRRPVRSHAGKWSLFLDEALPLPGITGEGQWRHTGEMAEFAKGSYQSATVQLDGQGKVGSVYCVLMDLPLAQEIAAFLNFMSWKPSRHVHGLGSRKNYVTSGSEMGHLHFIGGQWSASADFDGFVKLASQKPKGRRRLYFDECEAESVFSALPSNRISDEADALLAAALTAWAKTARRHKDTDLMLSHTGIFAGASDLRWSSSWEGRLVAASRLRGRLSGRTAASLDRLAQHVIREAMKGRFSYGDIRIPSAAGLFAAYHQALPDGLFKRVLKRLLRVGTKLPLETGRNAPSPEWFGRIKDRAASLGCLSMIVDAADWTAAFLPKEGMLTLGEAADWMECIRTAALKRWNFHSSRAGPSFCEKLAAGLEACADEDELGQWKALISEAAGFKPNWDDQGMTAKAA